MTVKDIYTVNCEHTFIRDCHGKTNQYKGQSWGKNYTVACIKVKQYPMYEDVVEILTVEKFDWKEVQG